MYTDKLYAITPKTTGAHLVNLGSTGVAAISWVNCGTQARIRRLALTVTALTTASTAPVVSIQVYPVAGSSSNAVTIATLTVPTATTAGQVIYKDISDITTGGLFKPGQEMVVNVTTAADTSGTAYFGFEADYSPEQAANVTAMVASA